jgi:DNA-binding NarL/FixJ family response regulator
MPDEFAYFMDASLMPFALAQRGQKEGRDPSKFGRTHSLPRPAVASTAAVLTNLAVQELVSRNVELTFHNRQLTAALAKLSAATAMPAPRVANLTPRQQQIMALVLAGHPSKNIAADLNISQRTVENHRAAIMRRTGAASIPALVRLSLT